ncbi:MAG TPA: Rieske (2Fe-2S) protein [Acidimicrobiia bacterium]|nr:Rieske (2Fe-2S) protein [Acidimicrobiia bacterium]
MKLDDLTTRIGRTESLDQVSGPLTGRVKRLIPPGALKDALSGVGLGHPLHPVATDVPIGCFTSATLLDLLAGRRAKGAVEGLLALGILAAVPTAASGAADWSDTYGEETRVGLVHATANVAAVTLYGASLAARLRGRSGWGRTLGLLGFGALGAGGYLGGYLSFSRGVGVNHAFDQQPPRNWTGVLDDSELGMGSSAKVEVDGATILLHRSAGGISAIGDRCSHAGGPLHEGKIDDSAGCVQCPWHGSVFDLADGSVIHGPASVPQASYETRIQNGRIEVRARP